MRDCLVPCPWQEAVPRTPWGTVSADLSLQAVPLPLTMTSLESGNNNAILPAAPGLSEQMTEYMQSTLVTIHF